MAWGGLRGGGLLLLAVACGRTGAETEGASQSSTGTGSSTTSTSGDPTAATSSSASGSGGVTEGESATGVTSQGPTEALTSTSGSTTATTATTDSTTDPSTTASSEGTTTTGGSTGTGSSGGSSSSGGGSGGSSSGSTGEPVQEGLWLTMLEDTSSPTRLYKIDLMSGAGTHLCDLDTSDNYNTSTFSRDGTLYAANASTLNLEVIDPCTCARTVVGPTKVAALPGITADQALGLYGMDTTLDNFVTIDTMNGGATVVGPLGLNWGTGGLTWSDVLQDTYAINGTDDKLYTINHLTGKATALIQTNYNFASVGIEWHPATQEIYACSNPAELLLVSEKTGEVSVIGPMMLQNAQAHCDNLAAPWVPVPCVENK